MIFILNILILNCFLGMQRKHGTKIKWRIKGISSEINLLNREQHLESVGISLSTTAYMRTRNINHKNKTLENS